MLGLDQRSYSPRVRAQIVLAGGLLKSFQTAALALAQLAGITISARHVGRVTEEIGAELAAQRDVRVEAHRHRQLEPAVANTPSVVAVEVDGGRLRTRGAGDGPGAHDPHWREDKIACLVTLQSAEQAADPQPEPPATFLDRQRAARLAQAVHGTVPAPADAADATEPIPAAEPPRAAAAGQPQRLVRTCVASLADSEAFGAMVAAEAQGRNFYAARRGAFVADGQKYNWAMQRRWFRDFEPIADFIHVLGYVYAAAQAVGSDAAAAWSQYEQWLRACWQGRGDTVSAALADWQTRLGPVGDGEQPLATDPRLVVAEARRYLENNRERMDYPRYRRQGLPVMSALVESLVKEFNYRVKGSEKFWDEAGGEEILQVRAALLSDDDRLATYLAQRPGRQLRRAG